MMYVCFRISKLNIKLKPSEFDWLTLNTEGSIQLNNKAGCGGVFREKSANKLQDITNAWETAIT